MAEAAPKGGYLKMFRKAFETHKYWLEKRVFSRWEAMQWIFQAAPWGDSYVATYQGHSEAVPRGHVLVSLRSLGKRFGWSKGKVARFLDELETDTTIRTVRETPIGTLYLIVNYEVYQGFETEDGTAIGTLNGTQAGRRRDKNNTEKKNNKDIGYSGDFEFFWNAYPKREGGDSKGKAYKAFKANLNRGVAYDVMFEKLKEYSAYVIEKGWVGTPYVMKASNWLGQEEGYKREWKVQTVAPAVAPEARKVAGVIPISRGPIQW